MDNQLNIKRVGEVFFTTTIFPYGFALLARKERLICKSIKSLGDLDYARRAR